MPAPSPTAAIRLGLTSFYQFISILVGFAHIPAKKHVRNTRLTKKVKNSKPTGEGVSGCGGFASPPSCMGFFFFVTWTRKRQWTRYSKNRVKHKIGRGSSEKILDFGRGGSVGLCPWFLTHSPSLLLQYSNKKTRNWIPSRNWKILPSLAIGGGCGVATADGRPLSPASDSSYPVNTVQLELGFLGTWCLNIHPVSICIIRLGIRGHLSSVESILFRKWIWTTRFDWIWLFDCI